ncbi:glucan biosynthesis protein [Alteromonas halophila]|uniref:Glucans biosynthesis protein G n=1 Tax=Alteromonas halophila TaxID=516698 RepID=A0A918MV78_9ALTE|nr:glucan biosynthesis protein G [Alteromonas halophila]GGW74386.1 glucans biosynthesis protein G [Alteromonas halophila]
MLNKPALVTLIGISLGLLAIFFAMGARSVSTDRMASQPENQTDTSTVAQQPVQEEKKKQDRPTHPFDREWLEDKAKALSKQAYEEKEIPEDNPLSQLDYDDYKKIQFERGATIWSREERQFRVNPLHPGSLYRTPVKLNLVVGGISRRILYTTEIFNYDEGQETVKNTKTDGYSGFSVATPLNRSEKWDEFLVFQGGTYFRAVGQSNWYGLSGRGLAINTGKPSGEEFPKFTEFWIERPSPSADRLVVHGLLESPSVTGAYTFTVHPGKHTKIAVESTLYPRTTIPHFGIAPLTSMFLFNAMDSADFDDYRPAVHDSDGLLMERSNGERIWRALANPERLQVSVFQDKNIRGFGLTQRSRKFSDYEDAQAHYHERPAAWVKPDGDWGEGHVELLEIPTNAEIHDNIVAFWQPTQPLQAGQSYVFNYDVMFGSDVPAIPSEGKVISSAAGLAQGSETLREFIIDYKAGDVPENLQVNASASTGQITETATTILPDSGHLRVIVKFAPGDDSLSELRVSLQHQKQQWGETWLYRWTQ